MSNNDWTFGPPPSVGWWEASVNCTADLFRWWDGLTWSLACTPGMTLDDVDARAAFAIPGPASRMAWRAIDPNQDLFW